MVIISLLSVLTCLRCSEEHPKSACEKTDDQAKCANCSLNHFASSKLCEHYRNAVQKKQQTLTQTTYAKTVKSNLTTVPLETHKTIEQNIQEIFEKMLESIAISLAEVIAKSVGDLMYEQSGGKSLLNVKGASRIANNTVIALNNPKFKLFPNQKMLDPDMINDHVTKRIFNLRPQEVAAAPQTASPAALQVVTPVAMATSKATSAVASAAPPSATPMAAATGESQNLLQAGTKNAHKPNGKPLSI
jgi:hypothetical protein